MSDETLLVIPTAWLRGLSLGRGFIPTPDALLDRLTPATLRPLARTRAEADPTFKQLVGYVIFRAHGQVFHYQRSERVGEARLAGRRSLGVGGHVNAGDLGARGVRDALAEGIRREVAEEVALERLPPFTYQGLIDLDDTPVSRVHLGIVAVADLAEPRLSLRDPTLVDGRFDTPADLLACSDQFETWSQVCLQYLAGAAG